MSWARARTASTPPLALAVSLRVSASGTSRLALCGLALSACGDSVARPDAQHTDASDELGLVRVHVTPATEPPSGRATIFFQNADSSIALVTHADDGGDANAYMRPHGFVTVVDGIGSNVTMFTYIDVSAGDTLYVRPEVPTRLASLSVHAPEAPLGTTFELLTACSSEFSNSAATQLTLSGCGESTDVLVITDTSGYAFADAVPLAGTPEVTLPRYAEFADSTVALSNVPKDSMFSVDHAFVLGSRPLTSGEELLQAVSGTVATTRSLPLPAGGLTRSRFTPSSEEWPRLISWNPSSSTVNLDYGALTPRVPTSSAVLDPAAMSIQWSESAHGEAPNASFVELRWLSNRGFRWQVLAPRTNGPLVRLPVLPDSALAPTQNVELRVFQVQTTGSATTGLHRALGAWDPTSGLDWPGAVEDGRLVWRAVPTE